MSRAEDERMADAIRQIVTRRERAPRSPRMERALKRLIWRYQRALRQPNASSPDKGPPPVERDNEDIIDARTCDQ